MTDEDAHLAAIRAAPEDDAPRLVYADWLDEHDEPERAEFIRVQCGLARLGPPPVVVTEWCALMKKYGPGYYVLTGAEETQRSRLVYEVQVGGRVDVMSPYNRSGKDMPPALGLRVHRIRGQASDELGRAEVILVRDAKSGPYAGWGLVERERELFGHHKCRWFDERMAVYHLDEQDAERWSLGRLTHAVVRRGFVDVLRAPVGELFGNGRLPAEAEAWRLPLTRLVLSDRHPTKIYNRWWWQRRVGRLADPDLVPFDLWPWLLEEWRKVDGASDGGRIGFQSEGAARDALNAAALAFYRGRT